MDLKVGLQRRKKTKRLEKSQKACVVFSAQAQARLSLTDDSAQTGIMMVLPLVYHGMQYKLRVLAYPAAETCLTKAFRALQKTRQACLSLVAVVNAED